MFNQTTNSLDPSAKRDILSILRGKITLSLLAKGIIMHTIILGAFSCIYLLYTNYIADDFGVQREGLIDTFINCILLSCFVTAGSVPSQIDPVSTLSRMFLITNVLLGSFIRIWLIAYE